MPVAVVYPQLPLAIDGSRIAGRRDDLVVHTPTDEAGFETMLGEADVLVISNATWDDEYIDHLDDGDLVQSMSAGYDRFPVEAFRDRGITFANTNVHGPVISEHVFALTLALTRRLSTLVENQRAHDWDRSVGMTATELGGRAMTVLGLGTIGEEVAKRSRAFEMDVIGVKRHPDDYDGHLPAENVIGPDEMSSVMPDTDVLVLSLPLTDETHHLIDADTFDALPESALLINVARGAVVDEDALIDALRDGDIGGAGLDVFDPQPLPPKSPLWDFDDVIVSPHVALHSDRYADNFADLFVENYDRWRSGERLVTQIA